MIDLMEALRRSVADVQERKRAQRKDSEEDESRPVEGRLSCTSRSGAQERLSALEFCVLVRLRLARRAPASCAWKRYLSILPW